MTEHDEAAEAAERELAELEERGERVGERIDEARADWRAKQADDGVPGATGEPDEGDGGDELPPPDPTETD